MKYSIPVDASSGYYIFKPDDKSSYLTTFLCLFNRYQYVRLAGDMFQKKVDALYSGMPNVFGIADEILIAGFDE